MSWKINPSRRRPGWLVVIGPKDPDFIKAIKAGIPARHRTWEPKLIAWLIEDHS